MANLVLAALGLVWIGSTALAFRRWGNWGLLGVPIGGAVLLGLCVLALWMACARGGQCP